MQTKYVSVDTFTHFTVYNASLFTLTLIIKTKK
jgi:hypothetical protein